MSAFGAFIFFIKINGVGNIRMTYCFIYAIIKKDVGFKFSMVCLRMDSAGRGITGRARGYIMKKVITYGTFDLFHKGHYNIIKRAKALGDYLIVGVTSESFDIERGKLNVRDSLIKRIENVRRTGLADEIIIEEYQGQKVSDIIKYDIDVLVVGSDWRGKFDYLKNYCDVVYLERTKNISSTKLRSEGIIFNMGIVTDDIQDNGFVQESK